MTVDEAQGILAALANDGQGQAELVNAAGENLRLIAVTHTAGAYSLVFESDL